MSLLVIDHLDTVLEIAQRAICGGKLGGAGPREVAARRQVGERVQRAAAAQLRMAAAENQLLGLHEELDLADAARA